MVNMTLSIPEELHKEIKAHSEIKWSDVARQAFQKKVQELHWMEKVLEDSEFTEKDAQELGHQVKSALLQRMLRRKR